MVPSRRQLELRADHRPRSASPTARSTSTADGAGDGLAPGRLGQLPPRPSRATATTPTATSVEFYAGWYRRRARSDTPDVLQVALDKPAYKIGETAQAPPRPALRRHRAGHGHRRPADRHEGGRGAGRRHHRRPRRSPTSGARAPMSRPRSTGRWTSRRSACRRARSASPGPRSIRATASSTSRSTCPTRCGRAGRWRFRSSIGNLAAGERGLRHGRRRRRRHPQPHQLQDAGAGRLVFRPAQARHGDPRPLRPADRPHAGRARRGPLGRRRRRGAARRRRRRPRSWSPSTPASSRSEPTARRPSPSTCPTSTAPSASWRWPGRRTGVGHAAKDVHRPRSGRGHREPAALPRDRRQVAPPRRDQQRRRRGRRLSRSPIDDRRAASASADADEQRIVTLAEKQRVAFNVPITGATHRRLSTSSVSLTLPDGESFPTDADARRPAAGRAGDAAEPRRASPPAASSPSTTSRSPSSCPARRRSHVSLGGAEPLDVAGILAALDRYPYGCVEQLTSRAMPLVYLDDVAISVGLGADKEVRERVQKAIAGVLADQAASGSFGLWGPDDAGDLWLDAYVTDFLTRAAEKGYDVPELARDLALDNLANRIAYAERLRQGRRGHRLCALRAGARPAGRRSATSATTPRPSSTPSRTPLAKAQIGAALALYGDRPRAGRRSRRRSPTSTAATTMHGWRRDYGTLAPRPGGGADARRRDANRQRRLRSLATRDRGERGGEALHQHAGECLDAAGRGGADQGLRSAHDFAVDGEPSPGRSSGASPASSSPAAPVDDREPRRRAARRGGRRRPACRWCRSRPAATASRSSGPTTRRTATRSTSRRWRRTTASSSCSR